MKLGLAMHVEQLIDLGFDKSTHAGAFITVQCSQCVAMVVNGTPLHEKGCPNTKSECTECGCSIPHNDVYCFDCISDPDVDFDVL